MRLLFLAAVQLGDDGVQVGGGDAFGSDFAQMEPLLLREHTAGVRARRSEELGGIVPVSLGAPKQSGQVGNLGRLRCTDLRACVPECKPLLGQELRRANVRGKHCSTRQKHATKGGGTPDNR